MTQKTRLIVRVEHKSDGFGIFQSMKHDNRRRRPVMRLRTIISGNDLLDRHNDKFPDTFTDSYILRYPDRDEFHAFKSIEQFQKWVKPNEIMDLINAGFNVLLLSVSDCVVGKHQILYKKENILNSKNISKLFL